MPQIKRETLVQFLNIVSRLLLGIVFIYAAIGKIPQDHLFAITVSDYHILPLALITPFAIILPWIELLVGLYFLLGIFQKYTAIGSLLLLLMFIYALSFAIITKQPVTGCGCFSQTVTSPIGWIDVIRDIGFIILSIFIYISSPSFLSIDYLLAKRKALHEN